MNEMDERVEAFAARREATLLARLDAEVARGKAASATWSALFESVPHSKGLIDEWNHKHREKAESRPMQRQHRRRESFSLPSANALVAGGLPVQFNGTRVLGNANKMLPGGYHAQDWVGWLAPYNRVAWDTRDAGTKGNITTLYMDWYFVPPEPGVYQIFRNGPEPHASVSGYLYQFWPHEWCNLLVATSSALEIYDRATGHYVSSQMFAESELCHAKRDAWTHEGPGIGYDSYCSTLPDWTGLLDLKQNYVLHLYAMLDIIWYYGAGANVSWRVDSFDFETNAADEILQAIRR
jgi:hypothetical protein